MKLFGAKKQPKILSETEKPVIVPQPAQTKKLPGIEKLEKGITSLADIIAPSSVEVDFNFIRVGDYFYKTFFVVGYPRFVSANWLAPLIDFDHSMNISMFCYSASSNDVLSDLRRKIAEMEATISSQAQEGKVMDPKVQAALEDALSLQEQLAKGVERFFQFSLYITLFSETLADLEETSKKLNSALSSILLITKTTTLQMEDLYKTLLGTEDAIARGLALRLEKFIKGSLNGIFNQQSNFDLTNPFTVFSIKAMKR